MKHVFWVILYWMNTTVICCCMQAVWWWRAVKGTVKVTSGDGIVDGRGQGAYVTGNFSLKKDSPPHFFPLGFILTFEIEISCYNYCSVKQPNSAKSIASHPSGYLAPAVHVLYMFQWAAAEGNGTVMWYMSVDRLTPGELPIPSLLFASLQ